MAASELKSLPAPARKRIEKLETTVSELRGMLGLLLTEMQRHGVAVPARKTGSGFQKAKLQRGRPFSVARKGQSAAPAESPQKAPAATTGLAAAVARGESAKLEWLSSGEVVPAKTLADRWGLTPQALGPAAARGEVFAVVVQRHRYYPKEFLELDRDDVGTVSKSLGDLSPEEKLVFWKRPHGALGGKTVFELLSSKKNRPQLLRVAQLAHSWAAQAHAEDDVAEAA
jgi:hypothetical protein